MTKACGCARGRESSEPDAYMPRNQALVDLLLERRQDIYCLQVWLIGCTRLYERLLVDGLAPGLGCVRGPARLLPC